MRPPDDAPRGQVLGRVADPRALDDGAGPIAAIELTAPASWAGRRVRAALPRALRCAPCGGGGCDACGRSGALRAPEDPAARTLELELPPTGEAPRLLRVPRPFGEASPIAQLHVTLREGPPSDRLAPLAPPEPSAAPRRSPAAVGLALAGLAAVIVALARWAAG